MSDQTQSTDFYAQKGMVRYTVILTPAKRDKFKEIASAQGLTQPELLEAMIDSFDPKHSASAIEAIKARKGTSASKIAKKLKDLSPEKLAEIEKLIG